VCLADFCEIFQCDVDETTVRLCNPVNMEKLKISCETLAGHCFPPHQEASYSFYKAFVNQICSRLTCLPYQPVSMESNTAIISIFRVIFTFLIIMLVLVVIGWFLVLKPRKGRHGSWQDRLLQALRIKRKIKGY